MRKQKKANIFFGLFLALLIFSTSIKAEEIWHFQAGLEVAKPGLVETVLPAGLFFKMNAGDPISDVDLSLKGPDNLDRSFELYWKEEMVARSLKLEPTRIYLDKDKGVVWEAALPKNFQVEEILVDLLGPEGLVRVRVEAQGSRQWRVLTRNAVLQNTGDGLTTAIKLEPAVYEQMRLCFQGLDKKFRKTMQPVRSVHVAGRSLAKDYAEKQIRLRFSDEKIGDERELSAVLPGSGLRVESLILTTDAQFQGAWQLGRQTVRSGKPEFQELFHGEVTAVNRNLKTLEIEVRQSWPGRSLILKLNPGMRYLGNILDLQLKVRLPRLVFAADKPGRYLALTGTGQSRAIHELPGDPERRIDQSPVFNEVLENRQWRPENLVEKYAGKGGPFNAKGYQQRAKISIEQSGYYRLVLNPQSGFDFDPPALRLVKDGVQIPYFRGADESLTIELPNEAQYDQKSNSSLWVIRLPEAKPRWDVLEFQARGIFMRRVFFEIQQPGPTGWKIWREQDWQNRAEQTANLNLDLAVLPESVREIRLRMAHGDNQPLVLDKIRAQYRVPVLLFLIANPGDYFLYGGNPKAEEPQYDLTLVEAHLSDALPGTALLEKAEKLSGSFFDSGIRDYFSEKSWGLYAVLGLVTLVLMFLIVRLFPKERKPE